MPIRQSILYSVAATLACAALTLNAAQANDHAIFKDVRKPGGRERTVAEKFADGEACGAIGPSHNVPFMPAFEKCMNGKGWALDHYTTNEARPAPGGTTTHYVDVKGDGNDHERGDAVLQVDTRACQMTAKTDKALGACLADHGWKYTMTQYGPPLPRPRVAATPQPSWSSWSSSGSPDTSVDDELRRDDERRRNDQSNRDIQAASDAINQAIQQTNEMNAAAAEQIQIQNSIANMPVFGQ
jgi:hypothetical protein